jgi:DNA repair protein RecO (recombination protein O)
MEWTDDGIVLASRPHGESAAVVVLLTAEHGRHAGLVRGATSPRARGVLQPGNRVQATWSARLAEHLGSYRIELTESHAPELFDDALKLAGLAAASAVAERALPEREPHPAIHNAMRALIGAMESEELGSAWIAAYVKWELGVLAELGFGLDLDHCAVTGNNDALAYVSPRSGRAVSLSAGEPYREKLLALPRFLVGGGGGARDDLLDGMALTGFFLERHVFGTHGEPPPAARDRFLERLRAMADSL